MRVWLKAGFEDYQGQQAKNLSSALYLQVKSAFLPACWSKRHLLMQHPIFIKQVWLFALKGE